jgi:hypothetical protein
LMLGLGLEFGLLTMVSQEIFKPKCMTLIDHSGDEHPEATVPKPKFMSYNYTNRPRS